MSENQEEKFTQNVFSENLNVHQNAHEIFESLWAQCLNVCKKTNN